MTKVLSIVKQESSMSAGLLASVFVKENNLQKNVIYKTIEITRNYFLFLFNKCRIEKIFVPNMVLRSDKV